jgi:hypothetical protein
MKTARLLFVMGLVLAMSFSAIAQEETSQRTATITSIKGSVDVMSQARPWEAASVGMVLNQSSVVRTKANSEATLNLDGGETATVIVKESSQMMLADMEQNKAEGSQRTMLDLALGQILIKARKIHSDKTSFEVKTPTSIVAVRGTTFSVAVETVE